MGKIDERIYYTYNDLTIQPGIVSYIQHRSECNPFDNDGKLPLFTAPMNTVINESNFSLFEKNGIYGILPRTESLETRKYYSQTDRWAAYSLKEFSDIFCNEKVKLSFTHKLKALIDVANGHMSVIFDLAKKAKAIYGDDLWLMGGNIANPYTYKLYAEAGFYALRVGIGGGCFLGDTNITLFDGTTKQIKDIKVGDVVNTINGAHKVIGTKEESVTSTVVINSSIECTPNHKFLVIDKVDKDKITEKNINEYAYYIEAEKLDKEKQLLVKIFEFIEIENIEIKEYESEISVYDLEVDEEHSYIANDFVVHNCGCLSSSNTSIHAPMATLIKQTANVKFNLGDKYPNKPYIIADGGIRNYRDIIKSLALGADYVMCGSIFSKMLESAAPKTSNVIGNITDDMINSDDIKCVNGQWMLGDEGLGEIKATFYGMASREGQIALNGVKTKTSEGLKKILNVEYKMGGWVQNMTDYLRSAMSYVGSKTLGEFREEAVLVVNSENAINAVNK